MAVPLWTLLVVLLVFPALYHMLGIAPWSRRLWFEGDRRWFLHFWGSVVMIHWVTTIVALWFWIDAGLPLARMGLPSAPALSAIVVALGALGLVVAVAYRSPLPEPATRGFTMPGPRTIGERCFWVIASLTAGLCEETIYRGFAITALMDFGIPAWPAALLAAIPFVLIHGIGGLRAYPIYYTVGVAFGAVFILTGSLLPGIVIHVLVDMAMLLGPRRSSLPAQQREAIDLQLGPTEGGITEQHS